MSAAIQKTQEPSMEDILASIRRIIADDQDGAAPAAQEADPFEAAEAEESEDVLDLAHFDEAESVEDDFVDDLEIVDLDGPETSVDEADVASMASAFDTLSVPSHDFAAVNDFDEPEAFEEPEPVFAPPPPSFTKRPTSQPLADQLLSSSADNAVSNAFNMLAHTVLSNNARTLEDLVREMMRPMLKVWLDDNLPTLVERLVRAEIERVARGR